ncbi:Na+/H+ antiporter [Spirosoma aerolatum]|uniref:Na+/H+ antiporter n=1 Tax=Spirosoma aerolatum TaxID=1211326 RepID=UPI0009ACE9F6|nr:Na+/H+ antiporter [Spirosoma aerolatum]
MIEQVTFYLGMVLVMIFLIILAQRIQVAYPVLLVVAGLAISFMPGIPVLNMDPELIFIIFLPPLLYEAAWSTSWKELWKWRRIILSFAILVVFVTAFSVSLIAYRFIPGFTLALGFLLGGIVSPPDAVSAGAIMKFVKVPKRLSSILEGESLLNDASSLIIFQFAVIAVSTGEFVVQDALLTFLWMVFGGVGIGLLVGWLLMKVHRWLPDHVDIHQVFSILGPYAMYIGAEEAHSSGVLATVSGGLLMSYHRFSFLNGQTRIRGYNFWSTVSFILNGLVFVLIGLDLPQIVSGLGQTSLGEAIGYGVLITVTLVVVRILSCYGAVITTLIMRNFITVADTGNPGWKTPLLLGWTGMRGVVSLAAALSIPIRLADGTPFPQRDLILFITFVVIFLTLVVQGLTLPFFIRKFGFTEQDYTKPEEKVDAFIEKEFAALALQYMRENLSEAELAQPVYQKLMKASAYRLSSEGTSAFSEPIKELYRHILDRQRRWLVEKNRTTMTLDEDIVRKHLYYLDHEEERLLLR